MLKQLGTFHAILAVAFFATPAFAEVCDKVRPRWHPSSGPVNQFEDLYFFLTSYFGIILFIAVASALYVNRRWFSWGIAFLLCCVALSQLAGFIWDSDAIAVTAVSEGCKTLPILSIGVLLSTSLFLLVRRRHVESQRLNTVGLVGDMDDVDILEAIEEAFGIKIGDEEAEKLESVGNLCNLVKAKVRSNSDFDPIWELVCQIVREQSGTRGAIDKETTFFSEHAKERQ